MTRDEVLRALLDVVRETDERPERPAGNEGELFELIRSKLEK